MVREYTGSASDGRFSFLLRGGSVVEFFFSLISGAVKSSMALVASLWALASCFHLETDEMVGYEECVGWGVDRRGERRRDM